MKNRYEQPKLKINLLSGAEVLTESEEPTFEGDGWVKDPFFEEA